MGLLDDFVSDFKKCFSPDDKPNFFEQFDYFIKQGFNVDRGSYGEYLTEYILKSEKIPGYRKVLCNLYVPYNNSTTEIDIILIHENGIYVIESKNYSGWIFGSANQQKWTQMLSKNKKNQFYNPILQNKTHISVLAKHMKIKPSFMKSYIVFSERCELKKIPENTEYYTITKRDKLLELLVNDVKSSSYLFSSSQIDIMYDYLTNLTNVSDDIKNKHKEEIKEKYQKKNNKDFSED